MSSEPAQSARLRDELRAAETLVVASSVAEALDELERTGERATVAVVPERSARGLGVDMAAELTRAAPGLSIILMSASPEGIDATAAIQAGQVDQAVAVSWRPGELMAAALRGHELASLRSEVADLRSRARRRADAAEAVGEVAAETSELGDRDQVARTIAAGLVRVAPAEIGAALLVEGDAPILAIHCREHCDQGLLRAARDRCLAAARGAIDGGVDEDRLAVQISGEPVTSGIPDTEIGDWRSHSIELAGRTVGMLMVVARRPGAFDREHAHALTVLARRTARTLRRLNDHQRSERQRLEDMIESMADGLILTDLSSDDVTINPAARRMLGIGDEVPVTTQFLKDRLGFYPFDLIVATRSGSAGPPGPLREEVRVGDQVLHSIVSPVTDPSDNLVGVVTVLRDMTEARELARRQSEFVSVVSHELRTPLTSITGALDIVLSDYAGRVGEKQRRYMQMAREACTRLNMIVDDLLDVARSETGRMPVQFTPLLLDELGREVAERFRPAAAAKQVDLRVTTGDEPIRIVGDAERLTQVLNNLLSNAIKFTPQEGVIDVEVFGPSVAANHVGVSVFNNGEPIAEEDQERIFDKFEQLQASTTRRVGGTGLGLAISRSIIEAHSGRIWVESSKQGTRFVFTLPAAPVIDDGTPELILDAPSAAVAAESDASVLLVDPDPHASYILKGLLIAAGYDVHLAGDADTALSIARTKHPNLMVVDAGDDPESTLALIEIFDHDPDTRKTAILALGPADAREPLLHAGADEVVEAPIDPVGFREACARLIAEAGRAQAPRILIVDDEIMIRTICRDVLESAGYQVFDAPDGAAAIQMARRCKPDLLLVDVMMPEMDGFETAEKFRAESSTSMTPVIFLSARGETADKVRAFRIGADDYIVKPFDAAELVARVAKALDRHSRELGASPTTQLPGADAIESEIERRLVDDRQHAYCYLDLDNLKAFNDYYGYAKADGVIRQTGDVIRDLVAREGNPGDFIGHIAGDDFVFITSPDCVDRVCKTIIETFSRLIPLYYNKADRERGYIETKDRWGVMRKFPIMSVSIAAVTEPVEGARFSALAHAAARGKKLAKEVIGSAYVRDGKIIIGDLPGSRAETAAGR